MNYKKILLLTALAVQSSFAVDYSLSVFGSKTVTRGYSFVFGVKPKITAGADEAAYLTVTGLPAGSTYTLWYMKIHCCGNYVRLSNEQPVQIKVPASASPGIYPVTVTYTSVSGTARSAIFELQVVQEPKVTPVSLPADTPLPELGQWRDNMARYGRMHCTANEAQVVSEGHAWYYDGARVYEQIAARLGDNSYLSCSQMFADGYRSYVEKGKGNIPGWRYFPHGQAMNYVRTGNQLPKAAVMMMADASPWAQKNWVTAWTIDEEVTRETAYAVQTLIYAERLGMPRSWKLSYLVDCLLSHFEQWYIQRTGTPQPFMVALSAEALIEYYQLTKDPRIPGVLKMAADGLWARSWDARSKSFLYEEFSNGTRVPAPDTNLLVVPIFGWVFQQTGEVIYRHRGDEIFGAGVRGAWLDGGKQFSMSYRWSGRYVTWRKTPLAKKTTDTGFELETAEDDGVF